ncbi:AI-2E family transporter [Ideonella sp. YS5]|uniref:AI-2E family transporter n=1 Tax=Ideonella sp. YS5 TaxID=3453714 RepID=UPI003EEBF505
MTTVESTKASSQHVWLVGLLLVVSIAFFVVIAPFYGAMMWGAILALLFAPLQRRLLRMLRGRSGWAALGTLTVVTLIVILPLTAISVSLAREAAHFAGGVQSGRIDVTAYLKHMLDVLPAPAMQVLDHFGVADAESIQRRVSEGVGRAGQFVGSQVLNIGQNTLDVVVGVFVALYIAFFMLRDGRTLWRQVWAVIPLQEHDKRQLADTFRTVVRATVKGNLLVALVQGVLGGLALWVIGIPGALLWGAVMSALSLLPAVGAALVWLPIALYLLATGSVWQGAGLTLFGVFVIGLVDNLLRPVLVGRDTKLPDWLVLVSTIGGIALMGLNGFVVGPVVAAMFVAAWSIFGRQHEDSQGPSTTSPAPRRSYSDEKVPQRDS